MNKIIICTDTWENFCCTGETIDDAYENFCAFHGNVDIEKLDFFEATPLPKQKGLDYN